MDYELEQQTNNLKPGEEIVATYQKKKIDKKPPYITVGNGISTKDFPAEVAMDAFKVFGKLSKTQQELFIDMKDIYVTQNMTNWQNKFKAENPNLVYLNKSKENEEHQNIKKRMGQNRNGSKLQELGVLIKVKNSVYMLNPYIFIPPYDFKKVSELWKEQLEHNNPSPQS